MGFETLLQGLRKELADGDVLVVVGSGVSIQASGNDRRATWDGLIRNGIDYCHGMNALSESEAETLKTRLESQDLNERLAVAELLTGALRDMGPGEFQRWLDDSVGALNLKNPAIIDAVHALGAPIATTNYDDLLSRKRQLWPIPWTNEAAVHDFVRGDYPGILHLHGTFRDHKSVILGMSSYETIMGSARAQAIQQALAVTRTILFIGCGEGLSDPNFRALLDFTNLFAEARYRHYSLCRDCDVVEFKKRHQTRSRFFCIPYGGRYDELSDFLLDKLVDRRAPPDDLPPPGHCFGRGREVERVVKELVKRKPRPVPVLGAPGIGKTTIVLKALHSKKVEKQFRARRWFVRCDGVRSRAELATAIARAMGLPVSPDNEAMVLAELAHGRAALALDNLETPLQADPTVEALLQKLSVIETLALIVTLRGTERPRGIAWALSVEPKPLALEIARRAFIAAAGKDFRQDAHLLRLLSALDGVPLAITLMAHIAESHSSLDLVWARWEGKRASIRDRVALSYEVPISMLTPGARRLLSVLASFPKGVAHIDLPGVFENPDEAADELRRRALVIDEGKRLRMLTPLREYVDAFHPPDMSASIHADFYYLNLTTAGAKRGVSEAEAIAPLASEVANIEAALARRSARIGWSDGAVQHVITVWGELLKYSGLGSMALLDEVVDQMRKQGEIEAAARLSMLVADIARERDDPEATRLYEKAMDLCHEAGLPTDA